MKSYRIDVEGVFVQFLEKKDKYGFYTTLYVAAPSALIAKDKASRLLAASVAKMQLREISDGLFRTTYFVNDIWEIDDDLSDDLLENSGLIFHPIHFFSQIVDLLRIYWLKSFKSAFLLN